MRVRMCVCVCVLAWRLAGVLGRVEYSILFLPLLHPALGEREEGKDNVWNVRMYVTKRVREHLRGLYGIVGTWRCFSPLGPFSLRSPQRVRLVIQRRRRLK